MARSRFWRAERSLRRHPQSLLVWRYGFLGKHLERCIERHGLLLLAAQAADRDRALGGFLLADDEQHRHLRQRVLADLVVDLLVAQIAFDAQPDALRRR